MRAYDFISLPPRTKKPRELGLTSVLDKGMGLLQTRDFLADTAPYIDLVKFGWGTSRLFNAKRLPDAVRPASSAWRAARSPPADTAS